MTKSLISPTFSLQTDSDELLYRQLYHRFKDAIANGNYPPGARVPSIRTLAQILNVSRNTVETAYDLLVGEGYFVSNGQAGTSIARQFSHQHMPRQCAPDTLLPEQLFQIGIPAQDAFPRKLWGKLYREHKEYQTVAESRGYAPLRKAIAAYLNIARGIQCSADQVIVTTGYRQSLQLLLTGLLDHGQSVWTEDPCYPPCQHLLAKNRIQRHPLPVDTEGIVVGEGVRQVPEARAAIVTPANQSPLGVVMSPQRRLELLDWAVGNQSWLIEDDYDSEYCGDSRLAPTLSGLDRHGRTFYMGTFSKTLCPSLRLAYVVVPDSQISHFIQLAELLLDGCPLHSQKTLTDMMQQGYFVRHIKKMRPLYEARRAMLIDVLTDRFGQQLSISPYSRGLCLLAYLPPGLRDIEVQARAARIGLTVGALSPRAQCHDYGQALLLGFANFTSRQDAEHAVDRLATCLD